LLADDHTFVDVNTGVDKGQTAFLRVRETVC
jgi:hypothetical protein